MGGFQRDARGSATVEMAVLMPMLLILMILLMYLTLYLYDRTVLYGDAYLAVLRAAELTEQTSGEVYGKADREFTALQEGQLIAMPEVSRELAVDADGVRMMYGGKVVVPVMSDSAFLEHWDCYFCSGDVYAARHRPVTFIRRCRVLESMLHGSGKADGEMEEEQPQEAEQ